MESFAIRKVYRKGQTLVTIACYVMVERDRTFRIGALLIFSVLLASACAKSEHTVDAKLDSTTPHPANELLSRVAAKYGSMDTHSYRDTGVVITTFHTKKTSSQRQTFSTLYTRRRLFRYEFSEPGRLGDIRYVVWTDDGNYVRSWSTLTPGVEHPRSIAVALEPLKAMSGGSSNTIPTLLLREEATGWQVTNLQSPMLVGQQPTGSATCYVVEAEHPQFEGTYRMWIDRDSLAIRRIYERMELPSSTVERTTLYEPVFNAPITAADVAFTPPARW